jgi:peptidoglycan hydrolase-like protein with peptidoglycan-binding domain
MRFALGILLLGLAQVVFADSTIQQAQETLKEQGYYYGQITGEKNADTTAAIRRFQIRNGLQVTGELNDETLRALNSNSAARVETATPAPQGNEPREEALKGDEPQSEARQPAVPIAPRPPRWQPPATFGPSQPQLADDIFSETPYATAPPQLQRQVLLGVQTSLQRRGLYRGQIDGLFGPEMEFALRAYQARLGLVPTGRLDMDTLASLQLLPGKRAPHIPRRPSAVEAPVRGDWIH